MPVRGHWDLCADGGRTRSRQSARFRWAYSPVESSSPQRPGHTTLIFVQEALRTHTL
jgi:hypothetical protein